MPTEQANGDKQEIHAITTMPCGCKVWKPSGLPADNCADHPPVAAIFIQPHNVPAALATIEYGQPFTIQFKKRKGGEIRDMLARREEPKEGGKAAYDFAAKNLMPVWDMEKGGYRSVSMDSVTRFFSNHKTFVVREGKA